ncbi:urea ABC transporter permease subunit UrtC [Chitinophaga japonensis]|uniref:Amino acid/amide ABC transporter membrane protein 2 (HAAT family) n=1 Tax=Chitinophaga japonensis TaxID=104662 RepID=A0A562T6A1_CHIJA|nr:urea ABC transporter permease subunit UrtC [Chitinophaga japonensis]TWI89067.1 amino acid/amide ABC transporter membrane protein 2 (HAAT family) [Chitinophaga japonensis]
MLKAKSSSKLATLLFVLFFAVALPAGHWLGIVSVNTISLWGRYFCFAIAALGIDLVWGYTGIMSMCQAFFFCLGGYCMGMHLLLKATALQGQELPAFMVWNNITELPFFWQPFNGFVPALLLSLLVPAVVAFVIGYFVFKSRIKGVYMAIITQALALAMYLLFLRNETKLGGTNGLTNFKTLLGLDLYAPGVKVGLYFVAFGMLCLAYVACRKIVGSKFGKILQAIRDSEPRVGYTAYRVLHYKLAVFVAAAVLAGVAGMLYVPQTGIITPGRMDVKASVEMLMWVALGGRGRLKGAIIGALLVNCLYSFCTSLFPEGWLFILGLLYVLTVLYFDKGFLGLLELLFKAKRLKIAESIKQKAKSHQGGYKYSRQ